MIGAGRLRFVLVMTAVAALEAAVRAGLVRRTVIVAPSEMATTLWAGLVSGRIPALAAPTFAIIAMAIAVAIAGGLALGLALASQRRWRAALEPLLASYYAVPIFVFYPLLIVLFGIGALPLVLIGSAFGVIAIAVSLLAGLDRIPETLLKTARLERMGWFETFWRIRLPHAAPSLAHGLKLAVATSFIGVIGGEFILAPEGLGRAIAYAYGDFDNPTLYALLLFVVTIVTAVNLGLHSFERRLRGRRGLA